MPPCPLNCFSQYFNVIILWYNFAPKRFRFLQCNAPPLPIALLFTVLQSYMQCLPYLPFALVRCEVMYCEIMLRWNFAPHWNVMHSTALWGNALHWMKCSSFQNVTNKFHIVLMQWPCLPIALHCIRLYNIHWLFQLMIEDMLVKYRYNEMSSLL